MDWQYTALIRAGFGDRNQTDFAKEFGLSRSMLNTVLNGALPGDAFAADLATALGATPQERADWQTQLEADRKARDREQQAARLRLKAGATPDVGVPAVARPAPSGDFRDAVLEGSRGHAAGRPAAEAPDVADAPHAGRAGELTHRAVVRPLHPAPRYVTREELDARLAQFRDEIVQRVLDARPDSPYKRAA